VIFPSLTFLVFALVTLSVYWALPHRWQNPFLLAASYVFYGWVHPWFLVLIAATTAAVHLSALGITRHPTQRRRWFWGAVAVNLVLLGFFKYFDFFVANVAATSAAVGWEVPVPVLRVALPVGISFYTFQALSYTVDVYRGQAQARTRFLDVATFVAFFPGLMAGPIMRAGALLPQIERPRRFDAAAVRDALVLIVWGLFKKLVVADSVGVVANKVFALKSPEFFVLWAGVFAFAIQVYADFSAYTDIARGIARWYGFEVPRNFDHPYLATGPADFWRRWNISVSTWFRDYVFLPLAYRLSRRIEAERWLGIDAASWAYIGAMFATMLATGLWHGASWNYVLWGAYHGVLLALARLASSRRRRRRPARSWLGPIQVTGMFLLTGVGWLIFRETDLAQLARHLTMSPIGTSTLDREAGLYLFLLTTLYAWPLWVQDAWAAWRGHDLTAVLDHPGMETGWVRAALQAMLCGLLVAGIYVLRSRAPMDFIYFAF